MIFRVFQHFFVKQALSHSFVAYDNLRKWTLDELVMCGGGLPAPLTLGFVLHTSTYIKMRIVLHGSAGRPDNLSVFSYIYHVDKFQHATQT